MKKTYAYVKYAAPKKNKHGSYDTAVAGMLCMGLSLNLTDKDSYTYKQAELEYPEDRFTILTTGGRRDLVDADGGMQDLNALLDAGVIRGRLFQSVYLTTEFTCLIDLTGGKPMGDDPGPLPPECPDCRGKCKVTALVDYADRARSGVKEIKCLTCQGTGTVTQEYRERKAAGEALRQDRLTRNLSLREEAMRLNINPRELSDREQGRLRADGEVDQKP